MFFAPPFVSFPFGEKFVSFGKVRSCPLLERGFLRGPVNFYREAKKPVSETPAFNGDLRMHDNVLTREIHGTATNYERTNRILAIDAGTD